MFLSKIPNKKNLTTITVTFTRHYSSSKKPPPKIQQYKKKTRTIARVKESLPEFNSPSSKVPILQPDLPLITTLARDIKFAGKRNVIEYDSSLSSHEYVCLSQLGNLNEIAKVTQVPKKTLKRIIAHPTFWLDAWFLNVPFGGASFRTLRPNVVSDGASAELNLMGANMMPFTDKILASHIRSQATLAQKIIVPDQFSYDSESFDYDVMLHSFLARTLWGHALIGSVSHNNLLFEDALYAMWIGAGHGTPLLGGGFNNLVACNEQLGTWPRLAENLREALMMKEFWLTLQEVYKHEKAEDQQAALIQLAKMVHLRRPLMSRAKNTAGILHTSAGFPVRVLSSGYGEALKAMAWYRGDPFSAIKN